MIYHISKSGYEGRPVVMCADAQGRVARTRRRPIFLRCDIRYSITSSAVTSRGNGEAEAPLRFVD